MTVVLNSPNARLREFRKNLGLNQEEMAKSLGLRQGSYSDIERGKVGLSGVINKLIKHHKVNPVWLLEGSGEVLIENEDSYFSETPEVSEDADRPDMEYKKAILDLLDTVEDLKESNQRKTVLSDLKSYIGRFVLENSRLLQENSRLKAEMLRLIQHQKKLKKILKL